MSAVGSQGPGGVDLAAVGRDDQLLNLLASRAGRGPADDEVAALLAAFVDEVDDGLAELLAGDGDFEAVPAGPEPGVRRGRGLRVTSVALVMGATLSVSGVAAAVTGDPLAPYKGLVSAVSGDDKLPEQAARVAALNRALRGTRVQIAHGDLDGAHGHLAALTTQLAAITGLSHGERTALQARIDALEDALARAEAKAARPANAGGHAPKPTRAGPPSQAPANGVGGNASEGTTKPDGKEKAKPGQGRDGGQSSERATKPSKDTRAGADDQGSSGVELDETPDPSSDDQGGGGSSDDSNGGSSAGAEQQDQD